MIISLIAIALQTTAPAADRTQPSGAERMGIAEDDVRAVHRFGQCVAERANLTAGRVLRQDFTTSAYQKGLRSMLDANRTCVPRGKRAQFSGVLGAGAVAEGLLEREGGALLARLPTAAASASAEGFSPSDVVARCVIKADAADVQALFSTEPTSAAEKTALSTLAEPLARCVPKGQDFRFNRPGMRAILAAASYRIVAAAAPTRG